VEKYTHMGMLFNKKRINNYNVLIPINAVRCNILDNYQYKVENFDTLETVFEDNFEFEDITIGFIVPIKTLKDKYGDLEKGIKIYTKTISNDFCYIQTYDYSSECATTYRIDTLDEINLVKIAKFEAGKLTLCRDTETYFNCDDDLDVENIKDLTGEEDIVDIDKSKFRDIFGEFKDDTNINQSSEISSSNIELAEKINLKELYQVLKKNVIGQDEAIKNILITMDMNYNIDNYRNKNNILLIGSSGCGKTEIFRTIADNINIPITMEDSEQYSAVGYVGASVEDMLVKLYNNANKNLELAQRGILVIDEIDKKLTNEKGDVSGDRILNSLLCLMEGSKFRINSSGDTLCPNWITFDTSFLTVVLMGACSDLVKTVKNVGFGKKLEMKVNYEDIDIDMLNKYGFSRELLRRVLIFRLNNLTVENLVTIMKDSANSALLEFYRYAIKKNIDLRIDDEAIYEIAKMAHEKGIGASGIKSTLNEILMRAFADIEIDDKGYDGIEVTKDSLDKIPPYKLIKTK
jgi:ATP-dependent Clp protease ATP-binding subunit ClpX